MILLTIVFSCFMYNYIAEACPGICYCTHATDCKGTYVNCSYRELTSLPTGIPADTCHLDLANNKLTNFGYKIFVGLKNLIRLLIKGNPFHCDCVLAGFVKCMIQFVNQSNAMCTTPHKQKGDYVKDLTSRECGECQTADESTTKQETSLSTLWKTENVFEFTKVQITKPRGTTFMGSPTTVISPNGLTTARTKTQNAFVFTKVQTTKSRDATFWGFPPTVHSHTGITTVRTNTTQRDIESRSHKIALLVSLGLNGFFFLLLLIMVCVIRKLFRNKRNETPRYINFEQRGGDSNDGGYTQLQHVRSDGYLEPINYFNHAKETVAQRNINVAYNGYVEILAEDVDLYI